MLAKLVVSFGLAAGLASGAPIPDLPPPMETARETAPAKLGPPIPSQLAPVQPEGAQPAMAPPAEAATPPSPPQPASSPERWLLMKSLQGTWPGAILDDERLQIYGWTDVSFTASSAEHNQLPMGFNYLANQFMLQQNWLRFELPVITNGAGPSFGFRSDTILPGTDYRFTTARGLFDSQLTANNGLPNTYGIDPIQFYAEAYFPNVIGGLDLKLGRVFCQYGVESNAATDNLLASHAYTFIYDPFTHTGIMGTLKLNDAWSVQGGLMLGSDVFIDPADEPTAMGSIKWAPPDGRDSVLFSFIAGSSRFNIRQDFNNPSIFDLVYTHQFNPRLTWNLETLYGFQDNVPTIGTAHWFGVINYLTYTITPRLNGTLRLEFFDDAQGQRTGYEGLFTALTAGLTFKPCAWLALRPEVRYDYNGDSRPFEGQHGLFTADFDLIFRW